VVPREARKKALAELYLPDGGYFSGVNAAGSTSRAAPTVLDADPSRSIRELPAIVVVCAELDGLASTDGDLGRLSWSAAPRSTRRAEPVPGAA